MIHLKLLYSVTLHNIIVWSSCIAQVANSQPSSLTSPDVNLVFKSPIKAGDDLKMLCLFAPLPNTIIYSVQWYKGQREIFRYIARDQEKKAVPFMDLSIDVKHSDMHTLMLKAVPAYMNGSLSCEVTPEDPTQKVVTKTAQLLVVVPPKERPLLETSLGMKNELLPQNQLMTANCTSSLSKPATNITFYINDIPLISTDKNVDIRVHKEQAAEDFGIGFGQLEIQLQSQNFQNGKITLRCEASLFNVYNSTSDSFFGELYKPKPQKQGSFFGGLGGASTSKLSAILVTAFIAAAALSSC